MQYIAMASMLIDHIGVLFYPNEVIWRIIGRLAFPLYAYGIVIGYTHTSNLRKYMIRIVFLAVIAQLPFSFAFQTFQLNIIFTLFFSLIGITLFDKVKNNTFRLISIAFLIFIMEYIPMDYGAYSLFLTLFYRYKKTWQTFILHILLNGIFLLYKGWDIQMVSVLSTLFIIMIPQFENVGREHTPQWLWRSFYPAHLFILAIISYFFS